MSPIRPENHHRYPADWHHIRATIRERAGGRCDLDASGQTTIEGIAA